MSVFTETVKTADVSQEALLQIEQEMQEEAQVILHCRIRSHRGDLLRIWATTFLIDHFSDHRSTLIHCENITVFPDWTEVREDSTYHFTLIFSALPRDCTLFHMEEIIPEPGGFEIRNIQRNKSDVYYVEL